MLLSAEPVVRGQATRAGYASCNDSKHKDVCNDDCGGCNENDVDDSGNGEREVDGDVDGSGDGTNNGDDNDSNGGEDGG